jgi:DNA-binding transcriptional MerR regulator
MRPDKHRLITGKELGQAARESYATVDHWSSLGLLIYRQRGHGNGARYYPANQNLMRMRLIRDLQNRDYSLASIRKSLVKEWPNDGDLSEHVRQVTTITQELVRFLAGHPDYLHRLSARKFEELVAEIVRDMGYDVELTPITRDGGRDVLAYLSTPLGRELTIIECKKYRQENRIGVEFVRQFLWVLEREDQANRGLIATTSYFSRTAMFLEKEHRWRLGLRDFNQITGWLADYGSWENRGNSGLWIPRDK